MCTPYFVGIVLSILLSLRKKLNPGTALPYLTIWGTKKDNLVSGQVLKQFLHSLLYQRLIKQGGNYRTNTFQLSIFHVYLLRNSEKRKDNSKPTCPTELLTLLEYANSMDSVDSLQRASIKWCKATSFRYLQQNYNIQTCKNDLPLLLSISKPFFHIQHLLKIISLEQYKFDFINRL